MEGGGREGGRKGGSSRGVRPTVDEACAYDILLAANCSAARSSAAGHGMRTVCHCQNFFFFYCQWQCCSHAVRQCPGSAA